jgi:2-(1,2-epoxy-1,2-dihydrophenyl)acetyl-CoA isomerase
MAGVKQARDGTVGILTLDEPASLNAMTPDLLGALAAALQASIRKSADAVEGRNACVEKRQAKFTGR